MMVKEEVVFENEIRKMIYNHIVNYPGVSFMTLLNIFELKDGGLRYHLNYLEKSDKIVVKLENSRRNYYPQFDIAQINKNFSMNIGQKKLTPLQNRLLETIKIYPGITQKDLIFKTKFSRSQINKNIKVLVNMNIVKEIKINRNTCYQLIPDKELKSIIVKRMIVKIINDDIDEETFLKLVKLLED